MREGNAKVNPAWASVLISAVVAIATTSLTIGVLKAGAAGLERGQTFIQNTIAELAKAVQSLAQSAAVNSAQHEDISRRLVIVEEAIGSHAEQISVLRTKAHVHANKLHEIDPQWRGYLKEEV